MEKSSQIILTKDEKYLKRTSFSPPPQSNTHTHSMLAFYNQKKNIRLEVFAFKFRQSLDEGSIREHLVAIPEPYSLPKWVENLSLVVEGALSLSVVLVDHYWSYLLPSGLYWTMSTDQTSGHTFDGTCTGTNILISINLHWWKSINYTDSL